MNAEQKQRAKDLLQQYASYTNPRLLMLVDMAALLQELIDAPEAEPVAKTTGYYGGHLTISTVDGRVLPFGTALYLAPPAPSVPDGWRIVPYTPTVQMLERAAYAVNNRPQPSEYEPSATPAIIFWTAMLNYAPEAVFINSCSKPPKLSDERILELWASNSGRPVTMGKARIIAQARAIEREIFGGLEK